MDYFKLGNCGWTIRDTGFGNRIQFWEIAFRLAEYNDFNSSLFMQPLLKWNPNPSTVFYIGGNTNINHFKSSEKKWLTDNSQLFLKLQYLFKAN